MSMSAPDQQNNPTPDPGAAPAKDLSQYIRTFAKDAAALGKQGAGVPSPAAPKVAPVAAPQPVAAKGDKADGVQFDPTEDVSAVRDERKEQPVVLESRQELDSYVSAKPAAPQPVPAPPEEDRAAVLERLRAKVASQKPPEPQAPAPYVPPAVETPPAPPVFMTPPEPPVNPMPPLYREPIEAEPVPVAPPIPEPVLAPLPAPETPTPMHTYKSDFTDRVGTHSTTQFSVLAAEQDVKPSSRQVPAKPRKSLVPLIAGLVLLLLAGTASYAAYLYVGARHTMPVVTLSVPSLIVADEYKKLSGTGPELMRELAQVVNEVLVNGNALVAYIEQPVTGTPGVIAGSPAPGGILIQALSLPAPDLLLRNITDASTVGVIREGGDTRAFFVLRVSSYERTFAGMLTWEPLMERDLELLYPLHKQAAAPEPEVDLNTASSTESASTTPAVQTTTPATSRGRFEDTIVANRDVRILRDTQGRTLMLYGYADKETLIIARNEASFAALLTRLIPTR
jgi:hypothetical protein